jgi:hypothetical protein
MPTAAVVVLRTIVLVVLALHRHAAGSGCPSGYAPLRLFYNLTILNGTDPLQCFTIGQVIDPVNCLGAGCTPQTCTSAEIIDKVLFEQRAMPALLAAQDVLQSNLCVRQSPGTPYDHVTTITSHSTFLNLSLVAVQQTTEFEGLYGRGTKSTINLVPNTVTATLALPDEECFHQFYSFVLHFSIHVLGFDVSQLNSWRLPSNPSQLYSSDANYPYGPVKPMDATSTSIMLPSDSSNTRFNASLVDGTHRVKLVSPNVVAAAQTHFGCSMIDGVLLEELGAAEMHWERRLMNYEIMTTEFNMAPSSRLSSLTLAALKDTGWYDLNAQGSGGGDYAWGRNWGCDFFQQECSEPTWRYWFCNATFGIAYDRSYASPCGNEALPAVYREAAYEHFVDTARGGWDPYADFCPYASNLSVVERCTAPRTSNAVSRLYSNITGPRTAVVYTTILNQSLEFADRDPFSVVPRCMEFLCLNTSAVMFRAGDAYYDCRPYPQLTELTFPVAQPTTAKTAPFSPTTAMPAYDFYGQIQCPDPGTVCVAGSPLYGDGGLFTSSTYPALELVEPMNASVAGGVTLTVKWSVSSSYMAAISCHGLLIGGQPTNISSYQDSGSSTIDKGRVVNGFSVRTIAVVASGSYGGVQDDGSGRVDVGLLCSIPNVMECGPQYDGMCLAAVWRQSFDLLSLPPPPAELGFLNSVTGQAVIALIGIFGLFLLLVLASWAAGKFSDQQIHSDGAEEENHLNEKLLENSSDNDVELGDMSGGAAQVPHQQLAVNHAVVTVQIVAPNANRPAEVTATTSQLPASPQGPPRPPSPPPEEASDDDVPPPSPPSGGSPAPLAKKKSVPVLKKRKEALPPPPPPPEDDEEIAL